MKVLSNIGKVPIKNYLKRKCEQCFQNIDDRSKSGLCISCCKKGILNPFYHKNHSLETKRLMKNKAKLRDKDSYYKIPSTDLIIRKRELSKKMNWSKLTIEEQHKRLEKFIKSGRKKQDTKIEKIMRAVLDDIGMIRNRDYETNVYINGFNVDLIANNHFIIDCYGDYWHKNPNQYNEEKDILKRNNDLKRKEFFILKI